jgi:CrcB protein
MWQKILFLGLAGAFGTLARYWLTGAVQRLTVTEFPLGTAAVNILGCLLFGLLWAFFESRLSVAPQVRTIIFVGFFGAFTTFSSFMFENSQLLDNSEWLQVSFNLLFQNVIGITGIIAGLAIGKLI